MARAKLDLSARTVQGRLVIRVAGDLDFTTSDRLGGYVAGLTADLADPRVVLDLADLDFCDSDGIGALVRVWKDLDSAGGALCLAAAQPRVSTVLRTTGLDTMLDLCDTLGEALSGP
ncbi:MAG: STAS domain-containing protein [Streptosporangiaceae bacterium]